MKIETVERILEEVFNSYPLRLFKSYGKLSHEQLFKKFQASRAARDLISSILVEPQPTEEALQDRIDLCKELIEDVCALPLYDPWELAYERLGGRPRKLTFEAAEAACQEVARRSEQGEKVETILEEVGETFGVSRSTLARLRQERRQCHEIDREQRNENSQYYFVVLPLIWHLTGARRPGIFFGGIK